MNLFGKKNVVCCLSVYLYKSSGKITYSCEMENTFRTISQEEFFQLKNEKSIHNMEEVVEDFSWKKITHFIFF